MKFWAHVLHFAVECSNLNPQSEIRILKFFNALDVDFYKGEGEGYDQRTSYQADYPKSLNSPEDREEEQKGMDVCSSADEHGPQNIVHHADE